MLTRLYAPAAFVVVSVTTPVAGFVIVILAPGIAAPCGSLIVPDSEPPATCAKTGTEYNKPSPTTIAKSRNAAFLGCMIQPPFHCNAKAWSVLRRRRTRACGSAHPQKAHSQTHLLSDESESPQTNSGGTGSIQWARFSTGNI